MLWSLSAKKLSKNPNLNMSNTKYSLLEEPHVLLAYSNATRKMWNDYGQAILSVQMW